MLDTMGMLSWQEVRKIQQHTIQEIKNPESLRPSKSHETGSPKASRLVPIITESFCLSRPSLEET